MQDPNSPMLDCKKCPASAQCPNKGPPVFETSGVKGALEINGDPDDLDSIIASLAASLGLDPSKIVLGDIKTARRGPLQIEFQIFADADDVSALSEKLASDDLVSALASNLAAMNITATVSATVTEASIATKREGEDWIMSDGTFFLVSCAPGFLLVNSTIDTQECKECEVGKFSLSYLDGCGSVSCDNRECTTCPDGAVCNKGSSESWRHFVPKALTLGEVQVGADLVPKILPWVNIKHSGRIFALFCHQENATCAPPVGTIDVPVTNDHVWEYKTSIKNFELASCPPGHRLVNSSQGVFNPTLQLCSPCGPNKYIIGVTIFAIFSAAASSDIRPARSSLLGVLACS